ncbi:MAG: hypothetical protein HYZ19_03880 [Rhodocyclales bacterium]|nr:hypothetical protein [Rhodocyclales bacterium]
MPKKPTAAAVAAGKPAADLLREPMSSVMARSRKKALDALPPRDLLAEAHERLHDAHLALAGLSDLLAGDGETSSRRIYYLIRPIEGEVAAAYECLHTAMEQRPCGP